ncbi:MAG: thiolase family protein [Deltaproteobacteria bacterium]|nr:thiolase family protein [Deltaproteobacteria bacterium]
MRDVYIVGVGMTRFGKHLERSEKDLTVEAVRTTLADAGIGTDSIEAAWFSNSMWGYFTNQHCIKGQVALRPLGIQGMPIINVENACAGASTALHGAWMGVAAGLYDCALAVGVEKLYNEDKNKTFRAYSAGVDVENIVEHFAAWRRVLDKLELEIPPDQDNAGDAGKSRSAFMDVYAGWCRWHMATYGTTQRQLAVIASKNHFHSTMNPFAQYQMDMSVEEVLAGRPVIYPLTVPMCAPVGDGSAAAVVCSGDFLKKLDAARPVRIRASVLASGTDRPIEDEKNDIGARCSRQAYEIAGVGPDDIDLAEVHDATAFGELHQCEALGFCPQGEGGPYAESGATRLGGSRPVNVSGGLESRGHPVGASGLGQIFELVTQLRHEAGKRQVEGCRLALAENGGGNLGFEEAAMAIHILEKVS